MNHYHIKICMLGRYKDYFRWNLLKTIDFFRMNHWVCFWFVDWGIMFGVFFLCFLYIIIFWHWVSPVINFKNSTFIILSKIMGSKIQSNFFFNFSYFFIFCFNLWILQFDFINNEFISLFFFFSYNFWFFSFSSLRSFWRRRNIY